MINRGRESLGVPVHRGRQYVSVATRAPRKRVVLPLRGRGRISGNVRIVLNPARQTVSVHMPYTVRFPAEPAGGPNVGLDAGVTEVLASSTGGKYGQGYGKLFERLSEKTTETGRGRRGAEVPARWLCKLDGRKRLCLPLGMSGVEVPAGRRSSLDGTRKYT